MFFSGECRRMFFWSDNWFLEKNTALFVAGETGKELYEYDFKSKICRYVLALPGEEGFRRYSFAIRYENNIFVIPDMAKEIVVYDEISKQFNAIKIENPDNVRLLFTSYFVIDGYKLYTYSYGLQKIIAVDMKLCSIIDEIQFSCTNKNISSVIKVGSSFFGVSRIDGNVYEVDFTNKNVNVHIIENTEGLSLICHDGNTFWLSGFEKIIYSWNLEDKKANEFKNFPENFGFCKKNGVDKTSEKDGVLPLFLYCLCVNDNVFFVPCSGNQILYVDKDSKKIQSIESLYDSDNVDEYFDFRIMNSVFLKQYIREDRFIGLYWLKKNKQLEYDTLTKTWNEMQCEYDISNMENDKWTHLREEEYGLCDYIKALNVWNTI